MASGWGFVWDRPPSAMAQEITALGAKIVAATAAAATILAGMAESRAKENASWIDQTGEARAGLVGYAESLAGMLVVIYLFHSVEYGKWLEIAMGMRYQIINPTLISLYPLVFITIRQQLGM